MHLWIWTDLTSPQDNEFILRRDGLKNQCNIAIRRWFRQTPPYSVDEVADTLASLRDECDYLREVIQKKDSEKAFGKRRWLWGRPSSASKSKTCVICFFPLRFRTRLILGCWSLWCIFWISGMIHSFIGFYIIGKKWETWVIKEDFYCLFFILHRIVDKNLAKNLHQIFHSFRSWLKKNNMKSDLMHLDDNNNNSWKVDNDLKDKQFDTATTKDRDSLVDQCTKAIRPGWFDQSPSYSIEEAQATLADLCRQLERNRDVTLIWEARAMYMKTNQGSWAFHIHMGITFDVFSWGVS